MPKNEAKAEQAASESPSKGGAIFDALTAMQGPFEREQPTMQERPELLELPDEDAQALADAYRESAAELVAAPLFDLDSGHGLSDADEEA
jgi:hypothetical protein